MSTVEKPKQELQKQSPAAAFRSRATQLSHNLLKDWVGEDRAAEATGRIATALSASAAASKKPEEFYACTPQSVAKVIAIAALTGIMPSTGAGALAYAIPRRPRKDEEPQLQYQLSHRGLNALANRAGMHMMAIPISYTDTIEVTESGDVTITERDLDNPPTNNMECRGVVVVGKRTDNGMVMFRGFVAKKVIDERMKGSDSYKYAENSGKDWAKDQSTWHKWYVEMAMKTAMHYSIARGWCIIDDTESVRALQADIEGDYDTMTVASTAAPAVGNRTTNLEAKLDAMVPLATETAETVNQDPYAKAAAEREARLAEQASSPQDA
jgi:recombinational DNA repair protein RecT